MKQRKPIAGFAIAAAVLLQGCAQVQAKAAYQDGNKAYKEENYKKAIEEYAEAVAKAPNMAEAWFYLGSSHQQLYRPGKETPENKQHLDEAIAGYKKALEVNTAGNENLAKVKINTLAALTAIYSEDPYKSYDDAKRYADELVRDNPSDAMNLYAMANLYEKFGRIQEAENTYRKVAELFPNDTKACSALAGFYNKPNWDEDGNVWAEESTKARRAKFDQAVSTLERCAALDPNDAGGWQKVASFYWDKAYRDPLLDDQGKEGYADKGLEAVDRALAIKPDYFEAVIYKGLLYRVKATVARNPVVRQQLIEQAQELQKQGLELKKKQDQEAAAAATGS
jgi:tetratricopeptide (TPR) repeat protein